MGALVPGARVVLLDKATQTSRSAVTNEEGRFRFSGAAAGDYRIAVSANGLEPGAVEASLRDGELLELPDIALRVATANSDVEVRLTQEDIAEDDIRVEEKQRLVGMVPNFYVAYDWNAPPLTAKQKFKLAGRAIIDPANFVIVGGIAGLQQASNNFAGYGQGAVGYWKRYAAGFGDFSIGTALGGAVLPVIFRQDPRYFYKGTGSARSRALYALSTGFIARGDNGKWQFAYASVMGDFASGAISNLYYPASNRSDGAVAVENGFLGIAFNGLGNLVQEFVLKKVTPGSRKTAANNP